ncbi:MAG: hypothetical protein KDB69_00500, partial [Acidimicrobiia bacterium]|nr:hypothetical protein [Acidimicrobiia bacterium]
MRAVVAVAVLASTFVIVPAAEAALPDVGFSVATSAHGEAAGTVDVTIELSTTGLPLTQALVFDVVDLATGTAGASDYSFTQPVPSLQFDVGDNDGATRTVQVTISQDSIDEPGETVDLELQAVSGGDVDPAAVGHELTISDDDAPPTISIGNATAANEGTNASFAVSLNHPSSQPISVAWTRANGTTTDGDFTGGAFGTVNFAALEVSKTISVPLNNDNVDEPGANETFTVALGAITGSASLGTSIGTGSIIDQTPTPSIAINDAAATEGSPVQFTVTLSRPSQASVTVGWTTNNGTAVAPGDYTADSDTVIFPPLSTSQPISVSTIADGVFEGGSENFTVTLSGPTNATISDSTGLGTINETGGAPSVSISDALNVDEGTSAVFNVTLSGQSANVITVP